MFLQRFRPSDHKILESPRKTHLLGRLQAAIRNIHTPQIKQHSKKDVFFSQRRYLIESTKKAVGVKTRRHTSHHQRLSQSQEGNPEEVPASRMTHRVSDERQTAGLPRRNGLKQRVWKSTDITSIMKLQEQKIVDSYQSQRASTERWRQQPRVERYHEMEQDHKQKIRKEWLSGVNASTALKGDGFRNSDAMQITNIEFSYNEPVGSNLHSQRVYARERRREQRRTQGGLTHRERRPNTTVIARRARLMSEDHMLAPW